MWQDVDPDNMSYEVSIYEYRLTLDLIIRLIVPTRSILQLRQNGQLGCIMK